jgi:hypothetical protein
MSEYLVLYQDGEDFGALKVKADSFADAEAEFKKYKFYSITMSEQAKILQISFGC